MIREFERWYASVAKLLTRGQAKGLEELLEGLFKDGMTPEEAAAIVVDAADDNDSLKPGGV